MDRSVAAKYCSIRRDLEERSWVLTSRHAALTSRLLQLIGKDHRTFVELKDECAETHRENTEARMLLLQHRVSHGC